MDGKYEYGNPIQVILTEPFTYFQKQLTKGKYLVRSNFVQRALIWLKGNTRLYEQIHIDETAIVQP